MIKKLAILGSTGSIGQQTLDIVANYPSRFKVLVLTTNNKVELMIEQAKKFKPQIVVVANKKKYFIVKNALQHLPIEVLAGSEGIDQAICLPEIDTVIAAMVGFVGLPPIVKAIKAKKNIALANKETLVVAGDLIIRLCKKFDISLIPIDSEHSAIFQCLAGEENNQVEKIFLTASGGPFLGKKISFLKNVTPQQALNHPTWSMGAKITIDSATLLNKGFEVIEAKWLFDLTSDQIEVVIHPQSIIHSMVQFTDGSIKAQMGIPDMRIPILYALTTPNRILSSFPRFSFSDFPCLSFEKPDISTFKCLPLAYSAIQKGGILPCVLNAANEVAVHAFLDKKIRFTDIPKLIEICMKNITFIEHPTYNDYLAYHYETQKTACDMINLL